MYQWRIDERETDRQTETERNRERQGEKEKRSGRKRWGGVTRILGGGDRPKSVLPVMQVKVFISPKYLIEPNPNSPALVEISLDKPAVFGILKYRSKHTEG